MWELAQRRFTGWSETAKAQPPYDADADLWLLRYMALILAHLPARRLWKPFIEYCSTHWSDSDHPTPQARFWGSQPSIGNVWLEEFSIALRVEHMALCTQKLVAPLPVKWQAETTAAELAIQLAPPKNNNTKRKYVVFQSDTENALVPIALETTEDWIAGLAPCSKRIAQDGITGNHLNWAERQTLAMHLVDSYKDGHDPTFELRKSIWASIVSEKHHLHLLDGLLAKESEITAKGCFHIHTCGLCPYAKTDKDTLFELQARCGEENNLGAPTKHPLQFQRRFREGHLLLV